MRRLILITLALSLGVAIPTLASAQVVSDTPAAITTTGDQAKPASDQAKPTPTAKPTAPQAPAAPTVEVPHSLFDQTWHQFQFGGRLTHIDGDPARFQRYQDVRDGVVH